MERARGGVPSVGVVKRRVLRGLWRRLVGVGIIGPGLLGAPATIMLVLLAALFCPALVRQRGIPLRHPLRCAGPRVVRPYDPRWGGHTCTGSAATTSPFPAH